MMRLRSSQSGATLLEYIFMAALVVAVGIVSLRALGTDTKEKNCAAVYALLDGGTTGTGLPAPGDPLYEECGIPPGPDLGDYPPQD
ncbi:MAG: hypothetical protein KDD64_16105 [Bdellovibrionales bacterium]|nr:hypothetical protein [Bdellovibrionales bacterium]